MVNKGAQAMLFVTVSEIRKRDPQAKIIVFVYDKWKSEENPDLYNLKFVPITMKHIMNLSNTLFSNAYVLGKRAKIKKNSIKLRMIEYILRNAEMAFDISGYALSNQWGLSASLFYLSKFALLQQYGIPTYVMPQSFGPFDYHDNIKNAIMRTYIKRYLSYPQIVFAREKEGFDCLTKEMGLSNVTLSSDLVLQNTEIKVSDIYKNKIIFKKIEIENGNNVAIIPNASNYRYGDKAQLLALYKKIIKQLNDLEKNVYLIAHSAQDTVVCKDIIDYCGKEYKIHFIEEDLNCIEYGMFIRKFDYIIASRFHSIVHAFKEHIPCIALGWAIKYEQLLGLLDQEGFNFDVRKLTNSEDVSKAVDIMENTFVSQAKVIANRLFDIQKNSCFNFLDDVIQSKDRTCNVSGVVGDGLCVSCGICEVVCPKNCITYTKLDGIYMPKIDEDECINCGKCIKLCPGRGFDYLKHWGDKIPLDNKLAGNSLSAYSARAKSDKILQESTSGGCVTQIVDYMLKNNTFDVAFCVKTHTYDSLVQTELVNSPDELINTAKSRYLPISHKNAIDYIINNPYKKTIFIGTSCCVHGLLNVINEYNLDRNNYLILGLFCDRTLSYNIWDYYNKRYSDGKLSSLYFRDKSDKGWPGNVVCVSDSRAINLSSKTRTEIKDYFQLPSCMYCYDKLNQFADISFGDDYANRDLAKNTNGLSSVVIRTELGRDVWESVSNLIVSDVEDFDNIIRSQHLHLRANNHTYELLHASVFGANNGFYGTAHSIDAVVNYDRKMSMINLGSKNKWDDIMEDIRRRNKYLIFTRIKRKIVKVIRRYY